MNERRFVTATHYRILAGVGLGMVCVAQDLQDIVFPNIVLGIFGLWMILYPRPSVPPLFIVVECVVQHMGQFQNYQSFRFTPTFVPFEPTSLLLSAGLLIFIGCEYRLIAMRWHAAPYDPRFTSPKLHDDTGRPLVAMNRPEAALGADEIVRFVVIVSICTLLAQLCWEMLGENWTILDFTPRFMRIAFLVWAGIVGLFVASGIVGYWRSMHDEPARARLYLQEIAWQEARREYARIGRWVAWGKRKMRRHRDL